MTAVCKHTWVLIGVAEARGDDTWQGVMTVLQKEKQTVRDGSLIRWRQACSGANQPILFEIQ